MTAKFQEPAPPRTLTDALARLDWVTQAPHTIDQLIGLHAEATSRLPALPAWATPGQLAKHMEDIANLGSTHADPTATGRTQTPSDLGPIDEAVWQICGAARDLDDHATACADTAPWRPPGQPVTRTEQLRDATTRIHHARSVGLDDHDCTDDRCDAPFRDHLVLERTFIDSAGWLHLKALGIWHASKGETQQVAEQKAITECRICGGWRKGTIAVAAGRCSDCSTFHGNHGVERTEAIVRRAEYGKGPTPAQMIEARAAKRSKRAERAS